MGNGAERMNEIDKKKRPSFLASQIRVFELLIKYITDCCNDKTIKTV